MKRVKCTTAYPSIDTGNPDECRPIPTEERDRLTYLASQGDEDAKQRLVKSCIRFAIKRATKYYVNNTDIPFTDFVQEACLGLIESVNKADINRGKFLTIARFYIDKNIKKLYSNKHIVSLPYHARWSGGKKKTKNKSILKAIEVVKSQSVQIDNFDICTDEETEDFDKSFLLESLKRILNELDQFDRKVIEIRYLSNSYVVPLREVARRLGKNLKFIELAEIRALKRMKEIVKEREIA